MPQGAILIMIAMSLTPAVDGLAKVMSHDYSPFFLSFARYLCAGLLALLLSLCLRQPVRMEREGRVGQVFRTALLAGAMTSLIAALSMVPLAQAAGGFLVAPVVATLICVFLFGEKLTPVRLLGSGISLFGAALIVRPEAAIEPGSLLALLGGALLGAYFAATRGMKDDSSVLSALTIQCLLAAAILSPFAFANGFPPYSWMLIPGALGLGALSAIAHCLTVTAYRQYDAALLSPFMYFNLIAALLIGYFWFAEVPPFISCIGLLAIVAGGLISIRLPERSVAKPLVFALS